MKKIALSCGIGNALEWFEFTLYAYFVHIIGTLFFPSSSSYSGFLMALGTFAAGFIARPVGAIIFGKIGDNTSRKKALSISIYAMAIPTTLIGFLPTYEQIGMMAPIMLIMLRIFQGLAIGGEFTGSFIFLVEHAPKHKRGFFGSTASFSAVFGVIIGSGIASLVFSYCNEAQLYSFGWRLPFILSALGGLIGTYIRKTIKDPVGYIQNQKHSHRSKASLRLLFSSYKINMLKVIMLDFLTAVGFFIVTVFISVYFQNFLNMGVVGQYINTFNMIIFALSTLMGGLLIDKFGIKRIMFTCCLGFMTFSYSAFQMMQMSNIINPLIGQGMLAIMMGVFFGAIPFALVTNFPMHVRFSGISLAHNISMAFFGGTVPLVASSLITYTGDLSSPAFILIISSTLSLIGVLCLRNQPVDDAAISTDFATSPLK